MALVVLFTLQSEQADSKAAMLCGRDITEQTIERACLSVRACLPMHQL
jgi:hypothetical protein